MTGEEGRDIVGEEIRIVVADDHPLVREGMRSMFARQDGMSVVGEAVDGEEALELVERLMPDVVILDASVPLVDGIEVAHHLRERRLRTRILVVSAHDLDDYVIALMEAGVDGYMMKTATSSQLIDAVVCVHRGERVLDYAIEQTMGEKLWARGRTTDEPEETLTRQERHVLQLAATGRRNKMIAAGLGISCRGVEARLSNVYIKLGVSSRVEAVLYAIHRGLVTLGRDGDIQARLN